MLTRFDLSEARVSSKHECNHESGQVSHDNVLLYVLGGISSRMGSNATSIAGNTHGRHSQMFLRLPGKIIRIIK